MSEKVQIGPLISSEAKEMLEEMARQDIRSFGNFLEVLIRREYKSRQRPHTLVDNKAEYATEQE